MPGAQAESLRPAPFQGAALPHPALPPACDALREWSGERADAEYVPILHLEATTMEATTMEANVDSALCLLLEACQPFDYAEVWDLAEPKPPEAPALDRGVGPEDLRRLFTIGLAGSEVCG